jgi:hypothetical protein
MFCSNCGAEASENFCSRCGAPLKNVPDSAGVVTQDWSREVRYEKLIRIPEVRDMISRHAAMAKKGLTGEELLAFLDKVIPLGFSLEKLGAIVQPISAQLGIKTGKEHSETLANHPGTIMVAALCSLARHGQVLQQVRQFEDGCLLEATLPSDMWSFQGTFYVSVRAVGTGTRVDGATKIKGQLFDWGKSKRCLETLFADIKATPGMTPFDSHGAQ